VEPRHENEQPEGDHRSEKPDTRVREANEEIQPADNREPAPGRRLAEGPRQCEMVDCAMREAKQHDTRSEREQLILS
jgi:hypothetical protein